MKPVIIIGGGGHAKVLLSTLRELDHPVLGFTDPNEELESLQGAARLGGDEAILNYDPDEIFLVNGVGSTQPGPVRAKIFHHWKAKGYHFATLIHPDAVVAQEAEIGEGSMILAGAVIQTDVRIGENTIINTRSSVDHDSDIGPHVHIAPGSTLCGAVTVGEGCHIGAGATIIQGITIGAGAMVAAGSVVLREVKPESRVLGNPARIIPS